MKIKLIVSKWLLKHLFCAVTIDDILEVHPKYVKLLGRKLTNSEIESIAQQANYLKESQIWEVVTEKMKEKANERMYEKSQSGSDLLFGKAMLYNVEVMDKVINQLRKI